MNESDNKVKVVIIGDTEVGKTSIIRRLVEDDFQEKELSTLGSCLTEMTFQINNRPIELKIWDTAGQEQFKSMVALYYRDAEICLLTYSVTNHDSFVGLKDWHANVIENTGITPQFLVIGNKYDLEDKKVTHSEAEKFASSISAELFEVSAKTGEGVFAAFQYAALIAYKDLTHTKCECKKINPVPPKTCVC